MLVERIFFLNEICNGKNFDFKNLDFENDNSKKWYYRRKGTTWNNIM